MDAFAAVTDTLALARADDCAVFALQEIAIETAIAACFIADVAAVGHSRATRARECVCREERNAYEQQRHPYASHYVPPDGINVAPGYIFSNQWHDARVRKELPATILVVEDDPAVVAALRDALQPHGVTVEATSEVASAKRMLDEATYCGLILDLVLDAGNGSGFDILNHVSRSNINVPTIVVTSKLPEYVREMLDASRVKLVFPKPIDSRLLATVILALCGTTS